MPESPLFQFPNRWVFARELLGNKKLVSKAMARDLLWAAVVATLVVTGLGGLGGVFVAGTVGAKVVSVVAPRAFGILAGWGILWATGMEDQAKRLARAASLPLVGLVNRGWEVVKRQLHACEQAFVEGFEAKGREREASRQASVQRESESVAKKLPRLRLRRVGVAAPQVQDARALFFKSVCEDLAQQKRLGAADYEIARKALLVAPKAQGQETAAARGYRLVVTQVASREVKSAQVVRRLAAAQAVTFGHTLAA